MDVQLTSELQAKLDHLANITGRSQGEFVQEAVAGYFQEIEQMGALLDSRYDGVTSGKVELMDGEEAFARLRAKSEARRNERP